MGNPSRHPSIFVLLAVPLLWLTAACQPNRPVPEPPAATPAPAVPVAAAGAVAGRVGDAADWCGGHAVPESMCPKCNAGVEEKFRAAGDWCEEHGFPESVCPSCNPMTPPGGKSTATAGAVAGRVGDAADWCGGHAVPESMCPKCNAGVEEKFRAAGDWCEAHGFPESVCPSCNPMTPPGGARLESPFAPGSKVRFRSARIEQAAGIEAVPVELASIGIGVECTARIDFNRNRLADVRTLVPGIITEVAVDLGQQVEAGQTLFVVQSAQVGDLQARRRSAQERAEAAQAHLARLEGLRASRIPSVRQLEEARAEAETAAAELGSIEQALLVSGASGSRRLESSGRLTLTAPIAGVVLRRPATLGSLATDGASLATIADLTTLWALLDVSETDAARVEIGQPVTVQVDGIAEHTFRGTVSWLAAEVDPRSRTVAVRAEIDNEQGLLRANQFARATIEVAAASGSVAVPTEAVQRFGADSVVFVRTAQQEYEPRQVRPGRSDGRRVQVEGDIEPGALVVTTGAFLIKTELMPGSIGAGCCEVEPPGVN